MRGREKPNYSTYIKHLFNHRRALFYDLGMSLLRNLRKQVVKFAGGLEDILSVVDLKIVKSRTYCSIIKLIIAQDR